MLPDEIYVALGFKNQLFRDHTTDLISFTVRFIGLANLEQLPKRSEMALCCKLEEFNP